MEKWIPKYIPRFQEKRARDIIYSIDWNAIFNTLISQGNWNSETLEDLINLGNISVKRSELSDDSTKLGGQFPSYYSAREKVIGIDEDTYRPGSKWLPTKSEHPANKRYVDNLQSYIEGLIEEYTVKYASGITILGVYDKWADFIKAHPKGKNGDTYLVGDRIITWDPLKNDWYDAGPVRGEKGDQGDVGFGFAPGGNRGQIAFKRSDLDYDMSYTSFTEDQVIISDTTRHITVSGDAPQNPQDGDIWIKI